MDLANWPPDGGGTGGRGAKFAVSPEKVSIKRIVRIVENRVDFICTFEGKDVNYSFAAPDEKTAQKLGIILNSNVGKTLFSIGTIEIPED